MKRNKENRILVQATSPQQEAFFKRDSIQNEDITSSTSNSRMLDNLKIALFFCQVQCQMSKDGLAR